MNIKTPEWKKVKLLFKTYPFLFLYSGHEQKELCNLP